MKSVRWKADIVSEYFLSAVSLIFSVLYSEEEKVTDRGGQTSPPVESEASAEFLITTRKRGVRLFTPPRYRQNKSHINRYFLFAPRPLGPLGVVYIVESQPATNNWHSTAEKESWSQRRPVTTKDDFLSNSRGRRISGRRQYIHIFFLLCYSQYTFFLFSKTYITGTHAGYIRSK